MAARLISQARARDALDLEIRGEIDASEIEYYVGYQKAIDDFVNGRLPPASLIDKLSAHHLIDIDQYLETVSHNIQWL
jgi:hypothetical protein